MKLYKLLLVMIIMLILLPTISSATWNNFSWLYKSPILINNTGNATDLKDYQVNLNITYDSDMQADFDDIRVVNDTSGTAVPYWIESKVNSSYANVWFNASNIPASVWTNSTYYLYYGNAAAASVSNVNTTFIREISGVVGAWRFDNNKTIDYSGNNNNGTQFGGVNCTVTGKFETGCRFDGVNDYVSYGNSATLKITNTLTIEAWIKPTGAQSSNIFYSDAGTGADIYSLTYNKILSNKVSIGYWDASTNSIRRFTSSNITLNVWTHIVGVRNADNTLDIYVNGQLNNGDTSGTPTSMRTNSPTIVTTGRAGNYNVEYFNGTIDEVSVYNNSLSAQEVLDLYNNYGYVTTSYPGRELIRKYIANEPTATLGTEEIAPVPVYSGASHNQTVGRLPTNFSITYNDGIALHPNGQYIFSTNNTGTWVNSSTYNFTTTPQTIFNVSVLNSTVGTVVGYRWYATDNDTNVGNTPIYTLTVTGISQNVTQEVVVQTQVQVTKTTALYPSTPKNLTATTGKFWVNYVWELGILNGNLNTDSFNVSVNNEWVNGSNNTLINTSSFPLGWVNISVYSYNLSYNNLNNTPINMNTQITIIPSFVSYNPLSPVYIPINVNNEFNITSDSIVNISWYINNILSQTNYSTSYAIFNYVNNTISNYTINSSFTYGPWTGANNSWNVFVYNPSPYIPINLLGSSSALVVNWTWNSTYNIGDNYNVYMNGLFDTNTSNKYRATNGVPHNWYNISVRTYNIHSNEISEWTNGSIQLVNNVPVINTGDSSVVAGQYLNITIDVTDIDGDYTYVSISGLPTNASFNATTKNFSWRPLNADFGTSVLTIYANDSYGGNTSKIVGVTVTGGGFPTILTKSNSKTNTDTSSVTVFGGEVITYSVIPNKVVGVRFWVDDELVQDSYDKNVYTINFSSGIHTIKSQVYDELDVSTNVTWTVTTEGVYVTNLIASVGSKSIYWTWEMPTFNGLSGVDVYFDGVERLVNNNIEFYYIAGLNSESIHTISIRVVDIYGTRYSWLNMTNVTLEYNAPTISTGLQGGIGGVFSPILGQTISFSFNYSSPTIPIKETSFVIYSEDSQLVTIVTNNYDFTTGNKVVSSSLVWDGKGLNHFIVPDGYYHYYYFVTNWDDETTEGNGIVTADSTSPTVITAPNVYTMYRVWEHERTTWDSTNPIRINIDSTIGRYNTSITGNSFAINPITQVDDLYSIAIKKVGFINIETSGNYSFTIEKDNSAIAYMYIEGFEIYNSNKGTTYYDDLFLNSGVYSMSILYARQHNLGNVTLIPKINNAPIVWYDASSDPYNIILTAADFQSNVSYIKYSLDTDPFVNYTGPINGEGAQLLTVCAYDIPNNPSCSVTTLGFLSLAPPVIPISLPTPNVVPPEPTAPTYQEPPGPVGSPNYPPPAQPSGGGGGVIGVVYGGGGGSGGYSGYIPPPYNPPPPSSTIYVYFNKVQYYISSPTENMTVSVVASNWDREGILMIFNPVGNIILFERTTSASFSRNIVLNSNMGLGRYTAVIFNASDISEIWSEATAFVLPTTQIKFSKSMYNLSETLNVVISVLPWNTAATPTIFNVQILLWSPSDPISGSSSQIIKIFNMGDINALIDNRNYYYETNIFTDLIGTYTVQMFIPTMGGTIKQNITTVQYGYQISQPEYEAIHISTTLRYTIDTTLTKYNLTTYIPGSYFDWNIYRYYYTSSGRKSFRPEMNERFTVIYLNGNFNEGFIFNISTATGNAYEYLDTLVANINGTNYNTMYDVYYDGNFIGYISNKTSFTFSFSDFSINTTNHVLSLVPTKIKLTILTRDCDSLVYIWSFSASLNGQERNITTSGSIVYYNLSYSTVTVTVDSEGYSSLTKSIGVFQDTIEIFDLCKIGDSTEITIPHYVKFTFQGVTGKRYENTVVQIYNNETFLFSALSGSDGAVAFKLNQTTKYTIHFLNPYYNFDKNYTLYPVDNSYTFIPLLDSTGLINNFTYLLTTSNISVMFTWNDVNNESLSINMNITNTLNAPVYEYYSIVTLSDTIPSNNYSIRISNATCSIPTTMWNVMNHTGADVQFYSVGKSNEYGFWIERLNSKTDFSIYVNVSNSGASTFRWYYGYENYAKSNYDNISETSNGITLLSLSDPIETFIYNTSLISTQTSTAKAGTLSYIFPIKTMTYTVNITIPTISHGTLLITRTIKPFGYEIPFPNVPEWMLMSTGLFIFFVTGMMFGYNHAGIGALIVAGMAVLLSTIGLLKFSVESQGILAVAVFLAIIGILRGRR